MSQQRLLEKSVRLLRRLVGMAAREFLNMRKNRVRGNFICGLTTAERKVEPGYRGHFHADFAEFWVVMLGELQWIFEGDFDNPVIAQEGDIVYAPAKTFHIPQFHGNEGLNCRLTSSTFPSANHIFDASPH